jgi:hypothetical protein
MNRNTIRNLGSERNTGTRRHNGTARSVRTTRPAYFGAKQASQNVTASQHTSYPRAEITHIEGQHNVVRLLDRAAREDSTCTSRSPFGQISDPSIVCSMTIRTAATAADGE